MSISKNISPSWVWISHGLSKLVTNLNNNEQETSEMQFEENALKRNAGNFGSRSKAKGKTRERDSAGSSTKTLLKWWKHLERCWTKRIFNLRLWSVEELDSSSSSWKSTSRKWWSNWILENQRHSVKKVCTVIIGLTTSGRKPWQEEEESRKKFSKVQIFPEKFFIFEFFRVISGHNLIDLSLQDNVLIPDDFFKYIYHVGCAINLHSIINSGLIPGEQHLSKERQTVFFTSVDLMNKEQTQRSRNNWPGSTTSYTVQAESVEETSKYEILDRHQFCSEERIEVLSKTIERYHLRETLPAYSIPKVVMIDWSGHTQKSICVTSSTSKDLVWDTIGKDNLVLNMLNDHLSTMTVQVVSKQCWTRWTWTSEFQGHHILLWSMRRARAFENWFGKLRTS